MLLLGLLYKNVLGGLRGDRGYWWEMGGISVRNVGNMLYRRAAGRYRVKDCTACVVVCSWF
jgi:hypothetical protein